MAARTDDRNKWNPEGESDDDLTEEQRMMEIMEQLGAGLEKEADGREGLKKKIEDRWIEDIRQDAGKYDSETERKIKAAKGSEAFANLTRPKRQMAESRLCDMLFPTDDRNFGIQPTPVPNMGPGGEEPAEVNGVPVATDENPGKQLTKHEAVMAVAKERAKNMEREIDDQLVEAKYHKVGREVIRDACLLGTGILKGPIIINRTRRAWVPIEGTDPETGEKFTEYKYEFAEDEIPSCECVDPFNFFPDPSADCIENSVSDFERHYMTKKQMIELAKRPDFELEQVRKVLEQEPNETPPNYLSLLREISGTDVESTEKRYKVWEYHGPVKKEQLQACGCEVDEDDVFTQYEGVIFICNSIVIKAVVNPMDTNERPYSVFCYEEDYASVFGYGVPYIMRNPQRNVNAAYRMTMDNAGLSTGPQIVVNDQIIEPVKIDGVIDWSLTARKIWRMTDPTRNVQEAFAAFTIDGHIKELTDLMTMVKQLSDVETNLPLVNQADEAPQNEAMRTAKGMEMLMNSNNVPMRRSVKNYDDNITKPFIGRFYNYNMQFSHKQEIKGDYQVDARGSSALLLKETQAKNIYTLANFAGAPKLDTMTKWPNLYRMMVQSAQIDPDEIVMTDDEIKAEEEKQQGQGQQDPEMEKNKMEYAIHRENLEDAAQERQAKMLMKQMDQTIAIIQNEKLMELEDKKGIQKIKEIILKTQGDRQKIADEAIIKAQYGSGI